MMKNRYFAAATSLVLTACMLFSSCTQTATPGSPAAPAADAGASTSAAPESVAPAGAVELRFMDVIPNAPRSEQFQKMIDSYTQQNPNVKVTLESTPWESAHQKLVTQGASNSLPDTFVMHQQWYSEFIEAGWVTKLDDYYASYEYKDEFIPYVKDILMDYDQVKARGGLYGLPDGLTTAGLFVRKDWVEAAGLTLADLETWEGVFAASEKMTIPEKNQYGFSYRGGRLGGEQMGMYVMSVLGGRLYDETGKCLLDTPEAKQAIKNYTDLYLKGYAPKDSINWAYPEMVQGFTSGLTGILNQTTEVVATCNESMQEGTWTTIPFPRAKDGKIYSKADSFVLAVGTSTKTPDAAFDFIGYMVSPEVNREYCKVNLYIPVMKGAESDPYFNDGPMAGFVKCMTDPGFVREPYYGYFPELGEFMETIYDAEIQKYLLGKQSLDDLVNNISGYLTTAQQQYMKDYPDVPIPEPIAIA